MKNSKTYLMGFWLRIPKLKQWFALCWPHNTCIIIDIKQLRWLFNEVILSLATRLSADMFLLCSMPAHSITFYSVLYCTGFKN